MQGVRGSSFFGVIGGLCGVLGDALVCLCVPGGSLGVSWDYLGCPWSSWEFVEGPWGVPEKSGTPQGALEINEMSFFFLLCVHKFPKPVYSRRYYSAFVLQCEKQLKIVEDPWTPSQALPSNQ